MIKMKCKVEGNRIITIDACGLTRIKNGDIFNIKNEDLIKPEIQFLISRNIISIEGESESQYILEEKKQSKPTSVLFKCNIDKGRKLTLDSIKGTVMGGEKIEIKSSDIYNKDITDAITRNLISPVNPNILIKTTKPTEQKTETPKVDSPKIFEEKKELEPKDIESKKEEPITKTEDKPQTSSQDITINDIALKVAKEEAPLFRVNDKIEASLQELGKNIYDINSSKNKVEEAKVENSASSEHPIEEKATPLIDDQTKTSLQELGKNIYESNDIKDSTEEEKTPEAATENTKDIEENVKPKRVTKRKTSKKGAKKSNAKDK